MTDLNYTFDKWGITQWDTNYPRGARLTSWNQEVVDRIVTLKYRKDGREVVLRMDKQARAVDNLRVLWLTVESMRLNEKRGIGKLMETAYLQLAAPKGQIDPYRVLGLPPGMAIVVYEAQYKELAKKYHTDNKETGDSEKMIEINQAIKEIRKREGVE